MTKNQLVRVVIVGGGFAGLAAAAVALTAPYAPCTFACAGQPIRVTPLRLEAELLSYKT